MTNSIAAFQIPDSRFQCRPSRRSVLHTARFHRLCEWTDSQATSSAACDWLAKEVLPWFCRSVRHTELLPKPCQHLRADKPAQERASPAPFQSSQLSAFNLSIIHRVTARIKKIAHLAPRRIDAITKPPATERALPRAYHRPTTLPVPPSPVFHFFHHAWPPSSIFHFPPSQRLRPFLPRGRAAERPSSNPPTTPPRPPPSPSIVRSFHRRDRRPPTAHPTHPGLLSVQPTLRCARLHRRAPDPVASLASSLNCHSWDLDFRPSVFSPPCVSPERPSFCRCVPRPTFASAGFPQTARTPPENCDRRPLAMLPGQ